MTGAPTGPLRGPYLGQARPVPTPALFARNLISTETTEPRPGGADGNDVYGHRWLVIFV